MDWRSAISIYLDAVKDQYADLTLWLVKQDIVEFAQESQKRGGGASVEDLVLDTVDGIIRLYSKKAETRTRRLYCIYNFVRYAYRAGWMPQQFSSLPVEMPDYQRVAVQYADKLVETTIQAYSKGEMFPLIFLGLLFSGVGVEEMFALQWGDITQSHDGVQLNIVESKYRYPVARVAVLSPRIPPDLFWGACQISDRRGDSKVVLLRMRGLSGQYRSLLEEVGMEQDMPLTRFTTFRWLYISDLVGSKSGIEKVAQVCGITSGRVRRFYPLIEQENYAIRTKTTRTIQPAVR